VNVRIVPKYPCRAYKTVTCMADGYPEPQYIWIDNVRNVTIRSQTIVLKPGPYNWTCIAYNNASCTHENPICRKFETLAWRRYRNDTNFPPILFNITGFVFNSTEYCEANDTITGYAVGQYTSIFYRVMLCFVKLIIIG